MWMNHSTIAPHKCVLFERGVDLEQIHECQAVTNDKIFASIANGVDGDEDFLRIFHRVTPSKIIL